MWKRVTINCFVCLIGKSERSSYPYGRESNPHCHQVSVTLNVFFCQRPVGERPGFIAASMCVKVFLLKRRLKSHLWVLRRMYRHQGFVFLSPSWVTTDHDEIHLGQSLKSAASRIIWEHFRGKICPNFQNKRWFFQENYFRIVFQSSNHFPVKENIKYFHKFRSDHCLTLISNKFSPV